MSPAHALLPPEPPNDEAASLRTLLHSTQDALFASMSEAAAQAELVSALQHQLAAMAEGAEELRRERDMLSEEAVGLRALTQDSVSADALYQRLDEAHAALDYCQQQRRSLQESATLQVEGLQQEVATLRARCEELAAQACCSMREAAALLKKLRGAA